ncbi:hypothetical protein PFISCL1PPCAC_11077 [Pristionchus fissidentatus]|uniref:C-type lectin n=1 Tax=Pristionchus fissidentatus TaxID=1538716 RepID=A0AAV5VM72_9BILA|nr:hypothetical protein PFISCL1PPCAC_11077 [Pristionchus fissidentatus]
MRGLLCVAIAATLACVASGAFRGQFANMFNTWHPGQDVKYVKDFDHLSEISHPETHEVEHTRKKRNAIEAARYASGNPITKACDRPGYTGQYCEFPICEEYNPFPNPEQYLTNVGYVIDLTDLGNCTHKHEIIVDESMYDIRIEVQSYEKVSPQLVITDSQGYVGKPDEEHADDDRYIAYFKVLAAGYYTLQPSAASIDSRCIMTTTAQTVMSISGGFQTDDRDRNDFPDNNAAAHQFNSILLHLNGARSPAELKTISVIGPDNFMFRPRLLDKRYGCQYEYYFDSLFCYTKGSYALIVEGVDFFGNPFRRTAPFDCLYKPGPPTSAAPPTTTTVAPTGCNNGGVFLNSGGKDSCVCQDHWTGPDCSQPLCINGGTLLEGKCFCTIGFEGDHCEQVKCEPNSNHGFGVDKPTLILVVRVREENNEIMKQVQKAVDEVVANLQTFDPLYLSRFHVVFFNAHTNFMSKHYSSVREFDLDFLKATISSNTVGGCTDGVIGAVTTGLTDMQLTQGSTIYVITDAVADDYDTEMEGLLQFNSYWRATINFVYVEPTAESQCVTDLSDPGFRSFDSIANRFGGMAWHVDDRSKVYDVMYGHLNSIIYKSQLMLSVDRDECGNGLGKVIQVEKTSENLVFISKGREFGLTIVGPQGDKLQPQVIVKQGIFNVWQISDPLPGAYLVKATTTPATASCNFRAYQARFQSYSPDSPVEAFWAISTDVDTDAIFYQPLSGMDNHPVFHIENWGETEDYDHAFAFLNMYAVRNGVEQEVYASNGLFRGGCSFHFYFPSFRCRPNENLHYEFNVRTEEGFYVQRAGVMMCFNSIPTPKPPTECQNGGVKVNDSCLCQPHYEGDHCQSVICENGGTPYFGACQCPAGWTGPFCLYAECSEPGPVPNFGYHVDMAFLVEVTQKGVGQIQSLIQNLPEIIRDVTSQHPEWIDRLVLIGYNSNDVIGMIDTPIGSTKKFFDTLTQWANSNPIDDGCKVKVWPALYKLLNTRQDGSDQRLLPDRSVINIFEASLPNNDDDPYMMASTSEELLERKTITNVFQWKDPNGANSWRCNGEQSDFVYLEQAARRGDGKMYTLSNGDVGKAIRMIPTLFSSSIVYKYHSEDCTMGHDIFFPVDAYTQTVTAIVAGNDATVELMKYDGTPFTSDGRIEILNDDRNHVVEFRNPCDSDWDPISQYCMYFNAALVKTFTEANLLCQHMGGFVTDDLTKEKNDWLKASMAGQKAWLGLTFVNNQWVFQHDDGTTMPVPPAVNFWVNGVIPTNSALGSCAYFSNGLWYQEACDQKHLVVCQKHLFDNDNQASDLGDDDMSPGKYYLNVKTEIEGTWKGCDVEVRVQSDLNVEFGFVDGLRKDSIHPVANVDSDANRVVSSISIGKGKTQTSLLQHVQLRSDDASSILLEAATYSYRLGCSYEWVSQPLTCEQTNGEDFSVVMIGEDDTGNTFQRYSTSLCYKWYICANGGVYSNGQCLCPDYYTGEDCRTPICQNGGMPAMTGRKCHCPKGYGGDACQYVQCDVNSGATFSNNDKALILVIEKSENTADAIQSLANSFHTIVTNMRDHHQEWIKYFLLETFTVDGKLDDLAMYYDTDDLIAHLDQIATESKTIPGACQGPIWTAFDHFFGSQFTQYLSGAEVLLVAAAAPLDADLAAVHATMEKFDVQTPIIDYLHVESPQCYVDDWAKGLGDFANFLSTTGGTIFRAQPADVGPSMEAFLPSRYAAQRLSYSDPFNCQNNEIFVQVDTYMTELYLMVGGKNARADIEDPKQNQMGFISYWTSDEQSLFRIYPQFPGTYKITISSPDRACFPLVYGFGGAQVFFGFVQGFNYLDTPKPYAVFGAANFPVFAIYDETKRNQSDTDVLYMASMTRQSFAGVSEDPYLSDVDYRDDCTYNYIGKAFSCTQENDVVTLSVSGIDESNQAFTRQTTTYCKADGSTKTTAAPVPTKTTEAPPTTTPPMPKTLNFDILFIIDETEKEGFIKDVAEPFIEKTLSIYTASQKFARVGLITMPQKAGQSMPVAFLSSIDSMDALDQDLTSLEDFNIAGDGEYLTQALQFANNPLKYRQEEHGYRNGISNHLIVILTEKNKFADKDGAIQEIQNIAEAQSYGVIAVGYGGGDWTDLTEIAGSDCVSIAADSAALLDTTTAFIQQKIWDATFNGGRYCAPVNIAMASRNH